MTLVFNAPGGAGTGEKPDNSPDFFSARKPNSKVLSLEFRAAHAKPVDHPWRYFVAGGESLAKIEEVLHDSANVDVAQKALAAEVGAIEADYSSFTFEGDPDVEQVAPVVRMEHKFAQGFVSDITAPGNFYPDYNSGSTRGLKEKIAAVEALPAGEVEAARAALAREYKAESFDGKFFQFKDWQKNVETSAYPEEDTFRLKSNPVFTRGQYDQDTFKPDMNTEVGYALAKRASDLHRHNYPQARLDDWLETFDIDLSLNGRQYSGTRREQAQAEKIGGEWIIKVPVTVEGIFGEDGKGGVRSGEKEGWVLPPGATPIAVSEYFAKLEKDGSLRSLPKAPKVKPN